MKINITTMSSCVKESSYVSKTQVQTLLSTLCLIYYFHSVNWALRRDILPVTISLVGKESPYMAEDSQLLILRTLSSLGSLSQLLPTATGRFSGQCREQHTYIDKNYKCLEGNLTAWSPIKTTAIFFFGVLDLCRSDFLGIFSVPDMNFLPWRELQILSRDPFVTVTIRLSMIASVGMGYLAGWDCRISHWDRGIMSSAYNHVHISLSFDIFICVFQCSWFRNMYILNCYALLVSWPFVMSCLS